MTNWRNDQLATFSTADDLRISPFYSDGKTYGTPTWIWSVVIGQSLYVRAWNGQNSHWYHSAKQQRAGAMSLAGKRYKIKFEAVVDELVNDQVDQAYAIKYSGSAYLASMVQAGPKSTTLRIIPRK